MQHIVVIFYGLFAIDELLTTFKIRHLVFVKLIIPSCVTLNTDLICVHYKHQTTISNYFRTIGDGSNYCCNYYPLAIA